jgi:outer membrane autotransporter protein
MKKFAIAAVLALATMAANAVEFGIVGSTVEQKNHFTDSVGLTVGQHFGKFSVTAEADRDVTKNINKFSTIGGYDVLTLGTATFAVKAGAGYVDTTKLIPADRIVGLVGVGVSVPVTKTVAMTADYRYQEGRDQAKTYNGNTFTVGAKFSF